MPIKEMVSLEEWDVEIKKHSLHLKFDSQLFFLEESIEAKIPRINRSLMEILFFPDAKKKEICQTYIESGEITNYFDLEAPVPISLEDQKKIDDEYQHELSFYTTKLSWLKDKLICCQKEMELRADEIVVRKPKGTVYYIDFDNGHDVNNDGTTKTKTNGDGPWKATAKALATLTAGDKAIFRRGMTDVYGADLNPANDGTPVLPITLEADFDDIWGDETVAGETATLTFGSKIVTFAGDISGDIAAGDWIYEATEDNREFAYEVASVSGGSNEIVTLYLPYKGNISGAGKTINIMPDNPIIDSDGGDFNWSWSSDTYWRFQGIHIISDDTSQAFNVSTGQILLFKDCVIYSATDDAADKGYSDLSGSDLVVFRKCRIIAGRCISVRGAVHCPDSLLTSIADAISESANWVLDETEIVSSGDIIYCYSSVPRAKFRNCPFTAADKVLEYQDGLAYGTVYFEDYDGVIGDSRQARMYATADDTFHIASETTKVRAGGGATSIKVTPDRNISTAWEPSWMLIHSGKAYALKDVQKTLTAYLSSDDDTDWDADPTASQLFMRVYYWGHLTNNHRKMLQSTEVCNNFDADDAIWDPISCTFIPLQTGVVYFEIWYCKTLEGGKSNIFYCDTKVPPT